MKNYLTFNIGCHFGSAIVNYDYSWLTNYEEKQLDRFLENLKNEYKTSYLIMQNFEDEPNFDRCEVSDLMSHCTKFTLELLE
jgi:hypothetical protein